MAILGVSPSPETRPCDDLHRCQLCGDRHGRMRPGRLGRYAMTCDDCEARRGSHFTPAAFLLHPA